MCYKGTNDLIIERFNSWIRVRYLNRHSAGITLSKLLKSTLTNNELQDALVIGIPRGGIITADIVAKNLSITNFDIIISRKLTYPDNKEQAFGAIVSDQVFLIMREMIKNYQISEEYIDKEIAFQFHELSNKRILYEKYFKDQMLFEKIKKSECIILVDDGIATGATMMVSIKWIKKFLPETDIHKKKIFIVTPVAPKNIVKQLKRDLSVEVVAIFQPSNLYTSVQDYYKDFEQITDDDVLKILKERSNVTHI